MQKPDYGVLVARCQVDALHEGHMALFREVMARHNRVILFLGVTPIGMTPNNPLDFETRKAMVQAKFPSFTVLPLLDTKGDAEWSQRLDSKIREVVDYGDVTLYGGRDSFVPHYKGNYTPQELALPKAIIGHSGTEIRNRITNTVMEDAAFRAGVIYALTNIRPSVKATVDIVIYRNRQVPNTDESGNLYRGIKTELDLLLGRKPGQTQWQFIGGFSEPTTPSYEYDAAREAKEETGLIVDNVEFIGSALIPDWRWKGEPDQIKSLIFKAAADPEAEAKAADDIAEVRWFKATDVVDSLFIDTHLTSVWPVVKAHFNL